MGRITAEFRQFLRTQLPLYAQALADALDNTEPSVAVRVNRRKAGGACGVIAGGANVAWCDDGFYLQSRPDFIFDPQMHQGRYYVQDASSMFQEHLVRCLSANLAGESAVPLRYLDACAAPGGKTTAAISALPEGSLVVANEFDFRRAEILKENVIKWGCPDVVVTRGDTSRFRCLQGCFDIVAADVPCSGEGMMRKDVTACRQWSESLVAVCAARQKEIISNLWDALRPGGYMIYSTCTFNRMENEAVMEWMMREFGAVREDVAVDSRWGLVDTGLMLRFLPSELRGEGLAIGVLKKPSESVVAFPRGEGESGAGRAGKQRGKARCRKADARGGGEYAPAVLRQRCGSWIENPDRFEFAMTGAGVVAMNSCHMAFLPRLQEALDVIYWGLAAGVVKGREIWPSHELAMSVALNRKAFPLVDVDCATALSYLRRETLPGFDAPPGAVLLSYDGYPLGFVNHLGNRSNNLYPSNWRILKR